MEVMPSERFGTGLKKQTAFFSGIQGNNSGMILTLPAQALCFGRPIIAYLPLPFSISVASLSTE